MRKEKNPLVPTAFCTRLAGKDALTLNTRTSATTEDVPLFVEYCEAVAAEINVKRRWLGEQGRVKKLFGYGMP
jgi:hypothetical protein